MMTGVNMIHVPYRGGAPALTDMIAGQIQVIFSPAPDSIEFIKAGRLRALAVTAETRLELLPEVPTVGDLRGERLLRPWRAQEHASRNSREAQQGDQCGPCQSHDEGAACRAGRHGACGVALRLCQIDRP
jgi:Tripartite tricarboxylate transporter family receptor